MKSHLLDIDDIGQILIVPKGRKVEAVDYAEGDSEIFLDLPDTLVSHLKELSYTWRCSVDEAAVRILEDYLKKFQDEEYEDVDVTDFVDSNE